MSDVFDAVVNERIKAAEQQRDDARRFRDHAEMCFWQDAVVALAGASGSFPLDLVTRADALVLARRERLAGTPAEVRLA